MNPPTLSPDRHRYPNSSPVGGYLQRIAAVDAERNTLVAALIRANLTTIARTAGCPPMLLESCESICLQVNARRHPTRVLVYQPAADHWVGDPIPGVWTIALNPGVYAWDSEEVNAIRVQLGSSRITWPNGWNGAGTQCYPLSYLDDAEWCLYTLMDGGS